MLLWITGSVEDMPAWVQILILSAGVIANFGIAFLALWPLLPRSPKIVAFLELDGGAIIGSRRGTIVLKNLGPGDVLDARVSKIPCDSRWLGMFWFIFSGPNDEELSAFDFLSGWRETYIQEGNECRIFIGELEPRIEAVQEALGIGNESVRIHLLEHLEIEYRSANRSRFFRKFNTATVPVSFAPVHRYLASRQSRGHT